MAPQLAAAVGRSRVVFISVPVPFGTATFRRPAGRVVKLIIGAIESTRPAKRRC